VTWLVRDDDGALLLGVCQGAGLHGQQGNMPSAPRGGDAPRDQEPARFKLPCSHLSDSLALEAAIVRTAAL
jgi:hypothetical protein